jgi:uncharacterized protein YndB with AHSA1/START domain
MTVAEMSKIERRVLIRAPRAKVWRALTEKGEFARWFGVEMTGTFQPGARVEMKSTHETECKGDVTWVDVQEMTPERVFSWRWHPGVTDPNLDYSREPTTLVEFRLEDAEGGTLVTVTETGFDRISLARRAGVFAQNEAGWTHQMNSLESYAGQAH